MSNPLLLILATGILLLWLLYATVVVAPAHTKQMQDRADALTLQEYQQEATRLHILECRHKAC